MNIEDGCKLLRAIVLKIIRDIIYIYIKLGILCILKVYKECVFVCVTLDDERGNCLRCSILAHHICF